MIENRVAVTQVIHPMFEHDWSHYADKVRVVMADGNAVVYVRKDYQPVPVMRDWLDHFNKTCQIGGYRYRKHNQNH